ncbi:MAG: PadR family transcriptional regulator [Sphingomicrobium sp.]|nr:PadR family transcriptional regulator [Sphingomonadales bacterium]
MHLHFGNHGCGHRSGHRHAGSRGFGANFGPDGFRFEFGGRGRGRHGWGGDDRPRGRRRMFGSGELRLVLLKLIADEPRHGYDLIRAIEERTGGQYAPSPGVVYPTLTMLQDMGLIEEQAAEGSRKAFSATDEGRAHLEQSREEAEALFERLDEARPEERHGGPNVGRAIGNLMAALRNRVAHDGFDDALVHEITAILDEAAQRIERLK